MNPRDFVINDLLIRIGIGEGGAMEELYNTTRYQLFSYVRRVVRDHSDVEEVMQDIYRQVWLSAAGYSIERGAPMAWLHMIARSRALDTLRRTRKSVLTEPLLDACLPMDGERQQLIRFEIGLVRRAFSALPDQQRHFIQLAFLDGYSHSEIATRTGIPLGTIKSRIRMALLRMRQMLDNNEALATSTGPQLVQSRKRQSHESSNCAA